MAQTKKPKEPEKNIKSIVYGGMDGIITTFSVVSGVAGAGLNPAITLVLGFANLFSDGISMGVGDYFSSRAEDEYKHKDKSKISLFNNRKKAQAKGRVTFTSFICFGMVPLLSYVAVLLMPSLTWDRFLVSAIATACTLFALGVYKARISKIGWFHSGFQTFFVGGLAATAAYFIGYSLSFLI